MTEARAQSTPSEGSRRQSELNREHSFGQHVSHVDCCHSPSCAVRSCGAQPPFWRGICWQRASFTVLRGWSGRCIWGQHRQESTFSLQLASCMPQLQVWSCLLPRSWHRRCMVAKSGSSPCDQPVGSRVGPTSCCMWPRSLRDLSPSLVVCMCVCVD